MKNMNWMRSGSVASFIAFLLIAFGGQAAAQTWTELAPVGGPPQSPGGTAVYDPDSNRAIHYGPCCNTTAVWTLAHADGLGGTPEWVNIVPAGAFGAPPGRHAHAQTYDSINNRMIIFSGCGGGCFPVLTDVWVLANADGFDPSGNPAAASWSQLFPTPDPSFGAPVGRAGPVAVYDPSSNQMILFGGQNGGGFGGATFPQVWRLSHANGLGGTPAWSRVAPAGTFPPGQYFSAAAYDAANNRMIVFSGAAQGTGVPTNAVWALSNANGTEAGTPTWSNVVAEGAPGSPPAGHWRDFTTYDPVNSRLILTDFLSGANVASWVLHHANGLGGPAAWQQLLTAGAPASLPRPLQNPVYNTTSNRLTGLRHTSSGVGAEAWVLTDANGLLADTIPPVTMASANPPANAAGWNNGAVTVTLSATDAGSGVQSIRYSINGGAATTVSGASTSFTVSAGGTHTISYYATDAAGNVEAAKTLVVKIDTIAPSTTASAAPPPNANGWNSGAVTVTLSATDNAGGSGVQSVCHTVTNGASSSGSCAAGASAAFTVSAEGTNTVSYHAVDVAGNVEAAKTLLVRIDQSAPVLALPGTITANATSPSGAAVSYTVTASDNSGLAPSVVCTPASGSTFPIGTSTVGCSATDAAGNSSSGGFAVTVLGSSAQTTNLIGFIGGLGLPGGTANSLTSKLENAVAQLASGGNVNAACNMLSAFINQASAQSGKQLTADQAAQLIASANQIRAAQGCP